MIKKLSSSTIVSKFDYQNFHKSQNLPITVEPLYNGQVGKVFLVRYNGGVSYMKVLSLLCCVHQQIVRYMEVSAIGSVC